MKLIVGLGNPGLMYARNRHNVGFMCLSHLAKIHHIKLDKKQGLARVGIGEIAKQKVILARPQIYMNLSGQAVARLAGKHHLSPQDIIVIYDDLDLVTGRIRLRQNSGSGGHNGIKSIIAELGSQDFYRVRVGIGRPPGTSDEVIDYVLGDFSAEERKIINRTIPLVAEAIQCLLTEGLDTAMNRFNQSLPA